MANFTCPKCGATSPLPNGTEAGMESQGLAMHQNLSDLPRPDVGYQNSPHRSGGDWAPQGIVIHYMAGTYEGSIGWFQNPASRVSAHFLVAKDGRRIQMVPLPDPDTEGPRDGRYKAWHCLGGNGRYLGIEHEGNGGEDEWTDDMLWSSAELAAYACSLYDIPLEGPPGPPGYREWFTGFGGHDNVPGNNHTDPGPFFPWEDYISRVAWYFNRLKVAPRDQAARASSPPPTTLKAPSRSYTTS